MHDEEPSNHEELTGLAAQLAALVPRAQLQRDQLMFAAGRARGRRMNIANGLLLAGNVVFAGLLAVALLNTGQPRDPVARRMQGDPATKVEIDVGTPQATNGSERDGPTDGLQDSRLAAADEFTSFQLLRALGRGDEWPPAKHPAAASPGADASEGPLHADPRTLLRRYLNDPQNRL